MKVLKFTLKGKTAFFKSNEVNSYYYFSYGQIHKPVLLGMFGAIMGYHGYETKYDEYPEYYRKLKDLKIAIVPHGKKGYFPRKMQTFNNSVGYASKESGGNLIVKEQWLENVGWTIYVQINDSESEKLADMILNKQCVFLPYLGKNDHPATIENVSCIDIEKVDCYGQTIQSLVESSQVSYQKLSEDFKYEEYLPVSINAQTNIYETKKMSLTDGIVEQSQVDVYGDDENNVVFY